MVDIFYKLKKKLKKIFRSLICRRRFFSFIKTISNKKLLIDFKIFKVNFIKNLIKISQSISLKIKHDNNNLIDKIWENRPTEKKREIFF